MKIAYIANMRFPSERAHATQIVHMANAFSALGHVVTLFVTTRQTAIAEEPETYYGVRFAFSLARIRIPDIVASLHRFPKVLHPYLFTFERMLFAFGFARVLRRESFDIVYCRDEWVLWFVTLFAPRAKVVWESLEAKHNLPARSLIARGRTVVISDGIRDRYVALGHRTENFVIAHDAVDDTFFAPQVSKAEARQRLGIVSDKPVVMYIGGFDAWKGVGTLFEASEMLPEAQVFVIGGKSDELPVLEKQYAKVRFLGPRPYKELPMHQQAADVLVVPNTAKNAQSASYTSPLKLFAHMTSKVPMVLSNIPSLSSVVGTDAAFFFTPDDAEDLSKVIVAVLKDGDVAKAKALRAYEQSSAYTWLHRASTILDFVCKT